jgi:hypothetical protein
MLDKRPFNKNNKPHGYWEVIFKKYKMGYKCYYINNIEYGYTEYIKIISHINIKQYTAR